MPGFFISFEGTEGSGKSSQIEPVRAWLSEHGRTVVVVREPGGTALSEDVRGLLLRSRPEPVDAWAELCLYAAARAQLVAERIRPALESGAAVLADRFAESSVAYQGGGRRLGARRVESLNRWATRDLRPDLILLFDLDPRIGLDRIRRERGLDRLESEPLAFHRRVRAAYLRMARREPERFRILDATLPRQTLEARVREEISAHPVGRGILGT